MHPFYFCNNFVKSLGILTVLGILAHLYSEVNLQQNSNKIAHLS